jgi:GDP-4-dehydro-6-deoxy-D-mannose reductase
MTTETAGSVSLAPVIWADNVTRALKLLLIGATGFAAAHLRRAAEATGTEVVGASRTPGAAELACDVLDPGSLERALAEAAPDAVANLSGAASVARSFSAPVQAFEVNAIGTLHLLEAVRKQAPGTHVLCISSGEAYGAVAEDELPAVEDTALRPVNPYGASKAAMEMVCRQGAAAGLDVCVIRAFNHTGPGQSETYAASSFARQVAQAEAAGADEVVLTTGNLSPARDFSDVRDMVRAYVAVLERRLTGTYNAAGGKPTQVRELIDHIQAATTLPIRVESDPGRLRPTDVPVLFGSAERLREATGWMPEIPLARTMSELLDWWRQEIPA